VKEHTNNTTQKVAIVNNTTDTLKRNLGSETGQTEPGLVALYDIRPGNGAGLFLQPRSPHSAAETRLVKQRTVRQFVFNRTFVYDSL